MNEPKTKMNFKINPWVAWFFLMAAGGIAGGLLANPLVLGFCGAGIFAGGVGYVVRNEL